MKFWITKWCLSDSRILEAETTNPNCEDGIARTVDCEEFSMDHYRLNLDYFLTEFDAVKDAESRKIKRIKQLQKQIEKLKQLKF